MAALVSMYLRNRFCIVADMHAGHLTSSLNRIERERQREEEPERDDILVAERVRKDLPLSVY